MSIPFVKVNNQQEFDRVVDKMQRETGLKLWDGTEFYGEWNVLNESDGELSLYRGLICEKEGKKIISADEYLTGVRTNFTLSDLEDGMVVELRNSDEKFYINLNRSFVGNEKFLHQDTYKNNLLNDNYSKYDIVKVYKPKNIYSLKGTFEEHNLTLIFDAEAHRNKLTIEQKKTDIQSKIDELNKQLEDLN